MDELSPSLLAHIATQMLNELPGANMVPKSEIDASHLPSAAMQTPASFQDYRPSEIAVPKSVGNSSSPPSGMPSLPTGFAPPSFGSMPSFSAMPTFSAAPSLPEFATATPAAGASQGSAGSSTNYDGLGAFVRKIQSSHAHPKSGLCSEDPNTDVLRRLFSAGGPAIGGSSRPLDVPSIRKDFPILNQRVHGKPLAWFDNAATTQKPQSVIDAISRFYANDNSNIHRGAHTLAARATDAYEQARQKVQGFLGASSAKEIIFVRGTTEGINLVAKTYGAKFLQPGDEIVLSNLEHHANIVPWQMIAKEKGAVIRVIPVTDRGEIMLEEYQKLLGPRTKLVALTQASNSLGTILPVAEMTQMAKRYNARVLIDGAQSVAHIPVNLQQLGADFYVFSGHKIFGPTGIGVVFVKEELQEIMPPWQGGGNMIKNVTFEETTFSDPPAKFEAGTPNIADAVGLGAALDYVSKLGLPNIANYEHQLLEYATEHLSRINGLRLIGTAREKVSVISFVLPNKRTEEVGKLLDMEGIAVRAGHHCSQPSLRRMGVETTVRPSFSFYNTKEEIDRLVDAVRRIQQQA